MTTKIAANDNEAMNNLFAEELSKTGSKVAAGEKLQCFDDHKDYVDTLETVLSDDKNDAWKPNDPILD
jgi:hypothetical protein